MESGIFFYWFCWILWILVTFFMKKCILRTLLACWILLTIIGSIFYVSLYSHTISFAFIMLFIGAIFLLSKQSNLLYHLFCSFTITIGYAALLFWESVSPVWMVFPRILIISVILGCIVSILSSHYFSRISICLFGMLAGEVIHGLTLFSYGLLEVIGELLFLDTLLGALLLLTFLDILQRGKTNLNALLENYKQNLRWQEK